MTLSRTTLTCVVIMTTAYLAALVALDFLRFPIRADELHFWPTSVGLFRDGWPSLEQLRSYNELNTPLPFLIFGALEYAFHGGITVGRAVNFWASIGVLLIVAAAGSYKPRALLCAIGLLLFPYFLGVATHLYTDMLAVLFTVAGVALWLRGHAWWSALFLVLAIACRQYIVAFPLALAASEFVNCLKQRRWPINPTIIAPVLAAASIFGWYWFFGGAAPRTALQAQEISAGRLYPEHGLYFLTCIGVFFVVVEGGLFRTLAGLGPPAPLTIGAAIMVSLLFWFSPPVENVVITSTMGYFDRAVRVVLPQDLRIPVYWLLALLACLRFRPLSLAGITLYINAFVLSGAHLAWDKYALPMLAVLWLLLSADQTDDCRTATPAAQAD